MEPHFFQAFFGPQETHVEQPLPTYIQHNHIILEISNNWNFVVDLLEKYKKGMVKNIDALEYLWLNFILGNNIDLSKYNTGDDFLKEFWKSS